VEKQKKKENKPRRKPNRKRKSREEPRNNHDQNAQKPKTLISLVMGRPNESLPCAAPQIGATMSDE
jgi:hypothetical protein